MTDNQEPRTVPEQYDLLSRLERTRERLRTKIRQNIAIEQQLEALSSFWLELSRCPDPSHSLDMALEMICGTLCVDLAIVFSIEGLPPRGRVEACKGIDRASAEALFASRALTPFVETDANPYGDRPNQYILGKESGGEYPLPAELAKLGMRWAAVVPFRHAGQMCGIVCVASASYEIPDRWHSALLVTMCSLIALIMDNTRLKSRYRDLMYKLRASERKYRQLLEDTNDAIWVVDLDGTVLSANAALARMVGTHLRYVVGHPENQFLHPEDMPLANNIRDQAAKGLLPESHERRIRNERSGKYSILKVSTSPVIRDDKVVALQHIGRDVTRERKSVENLRAYLKAITKAQEEERLRISRELHDSTAQTLVAMLNRLETHLRHTKGLPLSSSRFLWGLREDIKGVLHEVRHFARRLRPSVLDDLGLLPAIEWLLEEHRKNYGIHTNIVVTGEMRRLSDETETAIFRIVQEALNNVVRHAQASCASVEFDITPGSINIRVRDNGKGFEFSSTEELLLAGKLGLAGITERAQLLGGQVSVDSSPGKGTCISISVPV